MTDEDAANRLGFDHPSLGFIGAGSMPVDGISDLSSALPNGHVSSAFLDAAASWDLDASPPDSYDLSTTTTTTTVPSVQPGYVSPAWQTPTFDHQRHPGSCVPSGFGLPDINPASVFGSALESVERGTVLPPSRPPPSRPPPLLPVTTLTPALQEKLRNIAMPPHLQYGSPKSASSPESAKTGPGSSPDASSSSQKDCGRKRKVSADLDDDDLIEEAGKPVKKTAHNMIEKRYRTNINDKIAALRDSVPSLRIMCKSARGEDTTEDREELHGLTPAHKLNKATVLSKATEYIRHLEKRNNRLLEENGVMQARITAFEKLFMAGAMNGSMPPIQQPTPIQYAQDNRPPQLAPSPLETPQDLNAMPAGMIEVPEDMKRIISAQMTVGQPYPVPQVFRYPQTVMRQEHIQQQHQGQQGGWASASPYLGKLMVGSLAGLMILEAVRENETSNEEPQGRGLFALPVQLLRHLASSTDVHVMGYHAHLSVKFMLLLGVVLWAFIPSLFPSPGNKRKQQEATPLRPAPSLASPIHVRRQAWLTAVQTVWVPHHNFFLEAAALMLKTLKLSLRNTFGDHAYQVLTGVTPEQEAARVKAWSIALDSQLAGGDVDVCNSRLVLTLLASGTLPDSPTGLMLKALHVRVLLWDLSQNKFQLGLVNVIASKIARARWNEARHLNRLISQRGRSSSSSAPDPEELPEHLAALVECDCDDVLSDAVVQRAHNLAFNMETTHNIATPIDGMDGVVEDTAVGTPLDAVAAWWSMELLHDILTSILDKEDEEMAARAEQIELTLKVAPIGSLAQTRATLARAVFVDKTRGANIAAALQALRPLGGQAPLVNAMSLVNTSPQSLANPMSIANSSSHASSLDLRLSLRCAMALAHLNRMDGGEASSKELVHRLMETVLMLSTTSPMSLLGFTSAMELLEQVLENPVAAESFAPLVERLTANLRLWMGGPPGSKCGVRSDVQHKVIDRCLAITKSLVGMDLDTGYGSLSEDEDQGR